MVKILLAEDNALFRQAFRERLTDLFPSLTIEEVADGSQVLDKVGAFSPDLIFLDIRLPGETGLQLTPKIKKHYPGLPIIIVTNYDFPEYREVAYRSGASRFLIKSAMDWKEIETLIHEAHFESGNGEIKT